MAPAGSPATNQGVAYGTGNDARTASASHTFTGTGTFTGAAPDPVSFTVTGGPHNTQTDSCPTSNVVAPSGGNDGTFSYSCTLDNFPVATGTDTLSITSGTQTVNATKNWAGVPTGVTISPESDTAAVGTCNPFQVTVADAASTGTPSANAGTPGGTTGTTGSSPAGIPNPGAPVEVNVTPATVGPPANSATVTFCDVTTNSGGATFTNPATPTGAPTGTQGSAQPAGATGTTNRTGRFTADANGVVTFGISSTATGNYVVTAFVETRTDNAAVDCGGTPASFAPAPQAGSYAGSGSTSTGCEPYAVANKTFTAGGAASAASMDADPATATNVVGEPHTNTVLVCNNVGADQTSVVDTCPAGDPVPGVQVTETIVNNANALDTATGTCTTTNQQGIATCTFTKNAAGVFNLTFGITGNAGVTDTAQKTYIAATLAVDVNNPTPNPNGTPVGTAPTACSAADATAEDTVTQDAGTVRRVCARITGTGGTPDAGQTVTFSLTGPTGSTFVNCAQDPNQTAPAGAPGTVSATSPQTAQTDGNGIASVCVLSNSAGNVVVTAAAAGQTDTGTVTYTTNATDARIITLEPATNTNAPGTIRKLTATVTDRFGNPVAGVTVNFTNSGTGRFANGNQTTSGLTNNAGVAEVEVTTTASETGTSTVTATIGTGGTQCAQPAGTPAGAPAGDCEDTATVTWTGATTTTTAPGSTTTTTQPSNNQGNQQPGYTMVASDGGIFNFGTEFHGSTGNIRLNSPIVGMAYTATGKGYWLVAADGGIFAFGDAVFRGSTGNIRLASPIVGMAATPTGLGYWMVAADGGIFAFGDAVFRGSTGNIRLVSPIVTMMRTSDGGGYWLVASDGGVFAFGNAVFRGSTGNIVLAKPIVGAARTPTGNGYWMVASDGGVFAFGDAVFRGSTGNITLVRPVVTMLVTPTGGGYWLIASDGGVFAFGDAVFRGSTGNIRLNQPIVGGATPASGNA